VLHYANQEQDYHRSKYAKNVMLSRLITKHPKCTGTAEATPSFEVILMSFNQGGIAGIALLFVLVGELLVGNRSNSASPSDSETTFGDCDGDRVTSLDLVGDDVGAS